MMATKSSKILILGASGMLGNAVMRFSAKLSEFSVVGSVRSDSALGLMPEALRDQVFTGVDVLNQDCLTRLFAEVRPHTVVNCVGLVKQLAASDDPLAAIPINALLPHRLARLCDIAGARLIHISTDCVFSGRNGKYRDDDISDAVDLYGRTKYLGEVDYPHAVTLRTSIIGHELHSAHGLINWFLAQQDTIKGYTRAVFSGLPTVEFARVICETVIPRRDMHGVYNVSAEAISKYDLLQLVSKVYGTAISISADSTVVIDRSLDSTRFRELTGYTPPAWPELVRAMHQFK
jgi:dTDP-4-dehydrorhamnose reductase